VRYLIHIVTNPEGSLPSDAFRGAENKLVILQYVT